MKRRAESGVGFLIAPGVEVLEIYEPSDVARGRLLAIRLSVAGLRLKAVNCYAPHEGLSESMKDSFYAGLNSLSNQLDKQPRFKQVLFGDFNAVIGSDSAGSWGSACGSNSPNLRKTSANGLRLLKHCQHRGLMLANTWKRCRRRHRGTHFLQLYANIRQL